MESKTLLSTSAENLNSISKEILEFAGNQKVFLFYGEMGAGKTTLIKSLCEVLGVQEPTSSPTFSIVNEYEGRQNLIYHFDFYRLKDESEALDLGYEEYFYSGEYCFVEWPEKISSLLPANYLKISIEIVDPTQRKIL